MHRSVLSHHCFPSFNQGSGSWFIVILYQISRRSIYQSPAGPWCLVQFCQLPLYYIVSNSVALDIPFTALIFDSYNTI